MSVDIRRLDPYPSRVDRAQLLPRLDPVVWGDREGPLDPELVTTYEEQGYLVLPGFLPPST